MVNQSLAQMTLRDRLILAERTLREFNDHLEKGFLPKVADLVELVHPGPNGAFSENLRDITLRNSVEDILQSDQYTKESAQKFVELCESVEQSVAQIMDSK